MLNPARDPIATTETAPKGEQAARAARLYYKKPDDGCPCAPFAIDGRPLEVRIWYREPADGVECARHASGVWIQIRWAR